MNKIILTIVALVFSALHAAYAQDEVISTYGNKISSTDLKEYLNILASDAMEGRETGKRGQKMAAAFIRAHFDDLNLTGPIAGDFFQPMDLFTAVPGDTYVVSGKTKHKNFVDVAYYGADTTDGEVSLPLVFIGNGTEADINQVDIKGKAVLLLSKNSWLAGNKEVALAREKGAKMVLVSNTQSKEDFDKLAQQINSAAHKNPLSLAKPEISPYQRPGLFVVSPIIVGELMGTNIEKLISAAAEDPKKKPLKKIKAASIRYRTAIEIKTIVTENVLGLLEGSDKKNEIVLITAHYDHIGVKPNGTGDLINNGADDDGSGTVAIMEMAKVFADAKRDGHGPRRSILFMLVTAEEHGLLGSEFYGQNPIFSLENTIVDLNIDMIGRRDYKHQEGQPYLYVIGADKLSTQLNTVSEETNNRYSKLDFDYTYNDPEHPDRLYYRSDHWNFAKRNIPVIFYFDGIHEDYHKPTDEIGKIDFDLLAKRTQCIFYTAWELANMEKRIVVDK